MSCSNKVKKWNTKKKHACREYTHTHCLVVIYLSSLIRVPLLRELLLKFVSTHLPIS